MGTEDSSEPGYLTLLLNLGAVMVHFPALTLPVVLPQLVSPRKIT